MRRAHARSPPAPDGPWSRRVRSQAAADRRRSSAARSPPPSRSRSHRPGCSWRLKVAEWDIARRRTAPFRLIRPIDTRSQRRWVASSLASAIAIPCSRGCAPIVARRSRHDAACATSDARSFERRAQGSASSQPAPQRNCSATLSGATAGAPADVAKAMVAIATGSLAVPSGRATSTADRLGTGIGTDPTGSNDCAPLRIGAFGESREIAEIEVARRPRHRTGGALASCCRITSSPAATPGMRLHCSANQAEQNATSFPASSNPCQCGDADGCACTTRNCGAGSAFPDRLRSGSDICRPQKTGRQITCLEYRTIPISNQQVAAVPLPPITATLETDVGRCD